VINLIRIDGEQQKFARWIRISLSDSPQGLVWYFGWTGFTITTPGRIENVIKSELRFAFRIEPKGYFNFDDKIL